YNYAPLCLEHPKPEKRSNTTKPDGSKPFYLQQEDDAFSKNNEIFANANSQLNTPKLISDAIKLFADNESLLANIKKNIIFSGDQKDLTHAYNLHKIQIEHTKNIIFNHKIYLKTKLMLGGGHLNQDDYNNLLKEYHYVFHRLNIIEKVNYAYTNEMNT